MDKSWGSVILSGGKGRRMGYEDKSGLSYRGETFLEAISRQLGMLGGACYLSRAAYKAGEAHHGFTVIDDTVKGKDGEWIGPVLKGQGKTACSLCPVTCRCSVP